MKFIIPLQPTTKKNSQQIIYVKGKPIIIQNKRYIQFEKDCKWFIPKIDTIDYPINIKYTFYRKDRHICDLNGLIQALDDILVKYKVILDDNYKIVVGHDGSRIQIDKENPRIEVEINEIY
jgi:Holliday junction resolvase RusA-like endonuclease